MLGSGESRKEVTMASQSQQPTNERIVRLLEEVKAQLDDFTKRQEQIARDLTRLVEQR
jgi:hypothetical protein